MSKVIKTLGIAIDGGKIIKSDIIWTVPDNFYLLYVRNDGGIVGDLAIPLPDSKEEKK